MAKGKKTGGKDWEPGQSGNPGGRPPKEQALTDLLKQKADKERLSALLLEMAYKGDLQALKYVYDRIDGKPRETLETIIETPRTVGYYPSDFTQSTDTEDTEANTESEEV